MKEIGDGKELKVVFFVGGVKGNSKDLVSKITEEANQHKDMVHDMSYIDSYRNLTIKGMSAMKWVAAYCPNVYRVVKVRVSLLYTQSSSNKELNITKSKGY